MPRKPPPPPPPTEAELDLLRVLWRRGPSTVRALHDALGTLGGTTGYTTTLKLLQNMHAKGLVRRDDAHRQHVYTASVAEAPTLGALAARLVDRAFGGSAAALALHALGGGRASPDELAELKRLIARLERDERRAVEARDAPAGGGAS